MPEKIINTVDEYIAQFTAEIQKKLKDIRLTIREAAPTAQEKISWGMPTFRGNHNLIHFAGHKSHVGLYPGADAMEKFKDDFVGYKSSKGAVQFPYNKPIPLDLITKITKYRVEDDFKNMG